MDELQRGLARERTRPLTLLKEGRRGQERRRAAGESRVSSGSSSAASISRRPTSFTGRRRPVTSKSSMVRQTARPLRSVAKTGTVTTVIAVPNSGGPAGAAATVRVANSSRTAATERDRIDTASPRRAFESSRVVASKQRLSLQSNHLEFQMVNVQSNGPTNEARRPAGLKYIVLSTIYVAHP
jgi:hypothetical protein